MDKNSFKETLSISIYETYIIDYLGRSGQTKVDFVLSGNTYSTGFLLPGLENHWEHPERHWVHCKVLGTLFPGRLYTYSQLCCQAHEACGPMEIDSALSTVQTLKSELQDAKMAAVESQLKPLPGETVRDVRACCGLGLCLMSRSR